MRGNGRKRARSDDDNMEHDKDRKSQEWFRMNGFDDIGSAMKVNKGFLDCKADIGVWATNQRLVSDEDLQILQEELGVDLETRGSRDLRWFGANWKGYGQLEPTTPMPPRSQAIVDRICLKTGFPKVTVSTLHFYYRNKGKKIADDFSGEFSGRKYAIVPHTDDKLLRGNGGVMMLQVSGNAEVVMSVRKGNTSRVTASVKRDLGHILVCEGEAFLSPHQHSVLWVDDGSPTMMTLTMRSIPLDWEQREKKVFQKRTSENGRESTDNNNEKFGDRISELLSEKRNGRHNRHSDRSQRRDKFSDANSDTNERQNGNSERRYRGPRDDKEDGSTDRNKGWERNGNRDKQGQGYEGERGRNERGRHEVDRERDASRTRNRNRDREDRDTDNIRDRRDKDRRRDDSARDRNRDREDRSTDNIRDRRRDDDDSARDRNRDRRDDRKGDRGENGHREERDGRDSRRGGKGDRTVSRGPRYRSTTREPSRSPTPEKDIDRVFRNVSRSPSRIPEKMSYDEVKNLYAKKKALWNDFRERYKKELGCYPTVDDLEHVKLRAKKLLFEQCKELQEAKSKLKEEKKKRKEKKEKKDKKDKKGHKE